MKICPTSYVLREFLIKITMTYHYAPNRMARIQNVGNTKGWQGCGVKGALMRCQWEYKMAQLLWKTVWRFLTKLIIQ